MSDSASSCIDNELEQQTAFNHLKQIGDYALIRPIGIGGMGEVYLAEQKSMRRLVAVKILLPALVNNKYSLERFFLEVRTLAKIEHQNIVQAIEAGIENEVCFFSMMFVRGQNLADIIKHEKMMNSNVALKIVRDIAATLDYVWKKHQLIHRDIKPSNIMIAEDGMVKLLDLGISKIAGEKNLELTQNGMIVGSPFYVSPEQARNGEIDFHADMYSLGCTLYHMLTGNPPFDAPTSLGIISKHFCEPAIPPRNVNKKVSATVSAITMRMIAKKPYERYLQWQDLIDECDKYLNIHVSANSAPVIPVAAPVQMPTKPVATAIGQRRKRLIFILLVTIAAAAILIAYSRYEEKHRSVEVFCTTVINMAENCSEEQAPEVMAKLERIIKMEHPVYSVRARELLKNLSDKIVETRSADEKRRVEKAIIEVKQKVYALERQQRYRDAIQLWRYQLDAGQYRGNQLMRNAATAAIKELQESSTNSEQQLK